MRMPPGRMTREGSLARHHRGRGNGDVDLGGCRGAQRHSARRSRHVADESMEADEMLEGIAASAGRAVAGPPERPVFAIIPADVIRSSPEEFSTFLESVFADELFTSALRNSMLRAARYVPNGVSAASYCRSTCSGSGP